MLASAFENLQFVPSRGLSLVGVGELGPQLIEGYEALGGNVLKATPLALGFSQLLEVVVTLRLLVLELSLIFAPKGSARRSRHSGTS